MSRPSAEILSRAHLVKQVGVAGTTRQEVADVHAALYPLAEPVRTGCMKCVVDAFQAVLRYLRTNPDESNFSSTSFPSVMNTNTARFDTDERLYTPFGEGVAYNNDNLTDAVARHIIKNDPDAKKFFKVLPPAEQAAKVKDEKKAADKPAAGTTSKASGKAAAKATGVTTGTAATTTPAPNATTPATTPATTVVALTEDMHRDELDQIYLDEVKEGDPKAFANKGDLIAALTEFRAGQVAQ